MRLRGELSVGVMNMSYFVKITLLQEITALLVLTGSRAVP